MPTQIWKGLTHAQMNRVPFAIRPDTIVEGAGGYPAWPQDIGEPAGGQDVKIWTDASRGHAFLNAQGDNPTYDATQQGVDCSPGDEYRCNDNLRKNNLEYFEAVRTGTFCLSVKIDIHSAPSAGNVIPLMGTAQTSSEIGWRLDLSADGSGFVGLRARAMDGSSHLWDSGHVTQSYSASGTYDRITLTLDESQPLVKLNWNGSDIWSSSSPGIMSTGIAATNRFAICTDTGAGGAGDVDGIWKGIILDSGAFDVGSQQESWIDLNDYTVQP